MNASQNPKTSLKYNYHSVELGHQMSYGLSEPR